MAPRSRQELSGINSEKERSAVQIPDPFTKKLIIEATLEASRRGLLRGCKDLGGGGLATGLSEIADKGGTGLEVHLEKILVREQDMDPIEVMISESQERMLLVTKRGSERALQEIMHKYGVPCAGIAKVTSSGNIAILRSGELIADLPTQFLANAPTINRKARMPQMRKLEREPEPSKDLERAFLDLLAFPPIASKEWVFQQYDHEVGIRTVAKPGTADAAVLKLPNGKLAAIKVDGNSRFCNLDPYVGAASVLAECCRNVVAVGAEPIAFLDHCQFGDPNDEEIFWAFSMAIKGIADFARSLALPCVGGKVSFYNQDEETRKAINSSPVITVVGLVDKAEHVTKIGFKNNRETIIVVGETKQELGGSEYYSARGLNGNVPPAIDFQLEERTQKAVLECIRQGLVSACHDCSKGGLGIGLAEMAIQSSKGASIDLRKAPSGSGVSDEGLLFSESNSRFILTSNNPEQALEALSSRKVPAAAVGTVEGASLRIKLNSTKLEFQVDALKIGYLNSLREILEPWQK